MQGQPGDKKGAKKTDLPESDEQCSADSCESGADDVEIALLGDRKKKRKTRKKKQAQAKKATDEQEKSFTSKEPGVQPRIIAKKKEGDATIATAPHIYRAKLLSESVIKRESSNERVSSKVGQAVFQQYASNPMSKAQDNNYCHQLSIQGIATDISGREEILPLKSRMVQKPDQLAVAGSNFMFGMSQTPPVNS